MTELTIGQLAGRVGLRTSTLRFYEERGLLTPSGRTPAGYRLYDPAAERTLRFIQRAQRLGFSLADIRTLLHGLQADALTEETVFRLAEERFLALEQHLTEQLVQKHELEHLLLELPQEKKHAAGEATGSLIDRLLARVCAGPTEQTPADSLLEWLAERTDCALATSDAQALLETLRGLHVHVWRDKDAYRILVVNPDPAAEEALQQLAQLEAQCEVHPAPQLAPHEEGTLLTARGQNAFILARLFLALEKET